MKNYWLTSFLSIISCRQKSFDIILSSQICIFDKNGLGYESFKKKKYFKNYFVKNTSSTSLSTICNFYGREGYISRTCSLRN